MHSVAEKGLLPYGRFVRVQHQRPGAEMTEVEAHITTYLWFVLLQIVNGRLLTGSINLDVWPVGGS